MILKLVLFAFLFITSYTPIRAIVMYFVHNDWYFPAAIIIDIILSIIAAGIFAKAIVEWST